MDPLLHIAHCSQRCARAEKRLSAAKQALGLLNRLNALQRANGSSTRATAARISEVFARMNTLRAEVVRAKSAYHQAIEAVNLATVGQPANVRPRHSGKPLPGMATAAELMARINGPALNQHPMSLAD